MIFEMYKKLLKRKTFIILLIVFQWLGIIQPMYCQTISNKNVIKSLQTLDIEKGQVLVIAVYLDDSNPAEEIKNMNITISFNEDILDAVGVQVHNGMLSEYSFYDILQMDGKAIVRINGQGQNMQKGSVVEFLFNTINKGTTSVSIDTLTCNDFNISGGFLVDDEFFQSIYVKVIESDVFHISPIDDQIFLEDQPVDPIQFTIYVPGGYTSGFIAFSAISSNTQLIPQRNMQINGFGTDRYLLIIPAVNECGVADISISAIYGMQQDTCTFSIELLPVNDSPDFNIPSSIELPETSGPQLFTSWAKEISAGPLNESDQALEFIVSVDQPGLFYSLPEINPATGDLTFFPVDNMNGNAIISIYLKDDAGTENNGRNISDPKTVALTIMPFAPPLSDNPVERLAWITSNQPISPQKVTSFIRIMTCDENGDAVVMESDVQIWLSTEGSESGWFYVKSSEWSWQQSNALIVIPSGEYSALFKYRNAQAGNWLITASEIPSRGWIDTELSIRVISEYPDIPGDINRDGFIDLSDIILALRIISGFDVDMTVDASLADISGNNAIDLTEIIFVIKKLSVASQNFRFGSQRETTN
ncbi:MAG: hypothetical protein HQK75_19880 [Candidatus Magnetomorum sp.]|nr:hypothetical protein [Candidatus Magnetomorum sp.]